MTNPERLWVFDYWGDIRANVSLEAAQDDRRYNCHRSESPIAEYVHVDVAAAAVETERQRTWAGTVGEGKKMLDEARVINAALRVEVEALRGRIEAMRGLLESARRTGFDAADSGGRASAYRTMCNALVRDDVAAAKGVG